MRTGKAGGSGGKVKNPSKQKEAGQAEAMGGTRWKIPKKPTLLEIPSEEEELGQAKTPPRNSVAKFESIVPDMVRKKLDSGKLLPKDMSSLCSDFDKLVIHLATKQTWAKHCSAWALFDEFCTFFGIKFELPISPELARAFVTWALSKKKLKSSTVRSYISSMNILTFWVI